MLMCQLYFNESHSDMPYNQGQLDVMQSVCTIPSDKTITVSMSKTM
jgi:hypothetical protein